MDALKKLRYTVSFDGEVVGYNIPLTMDEAWKMMRRGYKLTIGPAC
jgi:hypothetical protein